MAERVGFEPTKELPPCWFSRPVLSTAQPSLLTNIYIKNDQLHFIYILSKYNLIFIYLLRYLLYDLHNFINIVL